jgi:gentisate 1,2-dioxygenase
MRYPWKRTEAALQRLAEHNGAEAAELDYIDPETGQSCLKTLGFTAMMLRPGQTLRPSLRSSSGVFHVVSGRGISVVNGQKHNWGPKDTFSAPVFANIEHQAEGDDFAFLVRIHDAPMQQRLGFYEERAR